MTRLRLGFRGAGFHATATNVGASLLGALTGVLSARYLGPTGRGEVAVALSVLGIVVQICDLSVVQTGSYFIARGRAPGVVLGTGVPILLSLASLAIPVSLIALPLLGYEGRSLTLNSVILMNVPLMLIAGLASVVPLGLGRYHEWNFCRLLMPAGYALAVVVTGFGFGLWTSGAVVSAYLVTSLLTTALAMVVAFRSVERLQFSRRFAGEWLKYSSSIHFGGLAANFNLNLDLILIGALLGSEEAGVYAVAVGFATPVALVSASYAAIALPEIARRSGDGRYRYAISMMKRAFAFSMAAGVIAAVIAPPVIPRLVGPAFRAAIDPFRILLLAQIVRSVNGVLASAHLGFGRPLVPTVAQFASLSLTVPVLVVFLPRWGVIGASWICLGTYSATFVVLICYFVKYRNGSEGEAEAKDRGGRTIPWKRDVR